MVDDLIMAKTRLTWWEMLDDVIDPFSSPDFIRKRNKMVMDQYPIGIPFIVHPKQWLDAETLETSEGNLLFVKKNSITSRMPIKIVPISVDKYGRIHTVS